MHPSSRSTDSDRARESNPAALTLDIPITAAMRHRAMERASVYQDLEVRSQVNRQVLAAQATNFYLQMLSIESCLQWSEPPLHPRAGLEPQAVPQVEPQAGARLGVKPGVGRGESRGEGRDEGRGEGRDEGRDEKLSELCCLAVSPDALSCPLPPRHREDGSQPPLGYIVVEIPPGLPRWAKLRGFVGAVQGKTLSLSRLQSLDFFLQRLHRPAVVALGQWIGQRVAESLKDLRGWQPLNEVWPSPSVPALAFRASPQDGARESGERIKQERFTQLHQRVQQLTWAAASSASSELSSDVTPGLTPDLTPGLTPDLTPDLTPEEPADPRTRLERMVRHTPDDEELRWQAADLLWTLEPGHEAAGVRRLTDLGLQFGEASVALMVAVLPRLDGNRAILLRLYPMGDVSTLPRGIELVGCDRQGETFLSAQARELDDYIQLKFAAHPEEAFTVKVMMDGAGVAEHFTA